MKRKADSNDYRRPNSRRAARFLVPAILILFLSGCINPFSGGSDKDAGGNGEDGGQAGSLEILLGAGVDGSTVAPDGTALSSAIASYTLVVEDSGANFDTITQENLTAASFPYTFADLPSSTWLVTLSGYNGSGQLIAQSPETPVTVSASGTSVNLTLSAIQSRAPGSFTYNLSWPAARVDGVTVSLFSVSDPANPISSGTAVDTFSSGSDYSINIPGGSLSVNSQQPSGSYLLQVDLSYNGVSYPSVYEAVQVYDYLPSSKSVTLTGADFTESPPTPTDFMVAFDAPQNGSVQLEIHWRDNAATEQGYRVYNGPVLQAEVGPNVESVALTTSVGPTPTSVTYEVVAYNDFGESDPLAMEFRILPEDRLPIIDTGIPNTNDPSWIAPNSWIRFVQPDNASSGNDQARNLYLSNSSDLSDPKTLPTPEATDIAFGQTADDGFDLTEDIPGGPTFGALETWHYRLEVEIDDGAGNSGLYLFPVYSFRRRDGVVYVSESNSGAGEAGSADAPLATIADGLNLAEAGEEIRVAAGTYNEGLVINQDIAITGSWNSDYTAQDLNGSPTSLTNTGGTETVTVTGGDVSLSYLEIYGATGGPSVIGLRNEGGTLTLTDNRFIAATGLPTSRMVHFPDVVDATVQGNEFVYPDIEPVSAPERVYGISLGDNADGTLVIGGPNPGEGNTFSSTVSGGNVNGGEAYGVFASSINSNALNVTVENNDFGTPADGSLTVDAGGTASVVYLPIENADKMIRSNRIYGPRGVPGGSPSLYGVRVTHATAPTTIIGNEIYMTENNDGTTNTAIRLSQDTAPSDRPLVINNYIEIGAQTNIGYGTGIFANTPTNIYNNVIVVADSVARAGSISARMVLFDTLGSGSDVSHNTFVNENNAGPARFIDADNSANITVYNNIFQGARTNSATANEYALYGDLGNFSVVDGNVFGYLADIHGANDSIIQQTSAQPFTRVADVNGEANADNNVWAIGVLDPANQYRPTADMPVRIRNSATVDITPQDQDGTNRTGFTAGAYELATTPVSDLAAGAIARWVRTQGAELSDSVGSADPLTAFGQGPSPQDDYHFAGLWNDTGLYFLTTDAGALADGTAGDLQSADFANGFTIGFHIANAETNGTAVSTSSPPQVRSAPAAEEVVRRGDFALAIVDTGTQPPYYEVRIGGNPVLPVSFPDSTVPSGIAHLAISVDPVSGSIIVAHDGEAVASVTGNPIVQSGVYSGNVVFGNGNNPGAPSMALEEIRLWSRPLNPQELEDADN